MSTTLAPINLNLAADYCPNWSNYEIIREFAANAIDSGNYAFEFIDDDTLLIKSMSAPSIEDALIIGRTSKSVRGDTIGQFGEGMKVAALTAVRSNIPLRISTVAHTLTFSLIAPPNFTTPTLHATVSAPTPLGKWGCVIALTIPNARGIFENNIKPRLAPGPITRVAPGAPRIYSQGIFIATLNGETAIFDWALPKIPLNRDRNLLNAWDIKSAVAPLLCRSMCLDSDIVSLLFENPMSFEVAALRYNTHTMTTDAQQAIISFFRKKYGDKAVLTSRDAATDARAIRRGYTVVNGLSDNLLCILGYMPGIFTAANVLTEAERHTIIDGFTHPALDELSAAADLLNCPCTIKVFDDPEPLGKSLSDGTILLNRSLFEPGQRLQRLATFFHEAAHRRSNNADDGTPEFEEALTILGGHLLTSLLTPRKD